MPKPQGHRIDRITFLAHPCCYAASLEQVVNMPHERWIAYHEHEVVVEQRWYETIARVGEREAMAYQPCYQSAEEKALAEHGRKHLGDRFLTLAGRDISTPEGATPETLAALAPDISEAFRVRGKIGWPAHDLRVAVFSYNYARDLLAAFAQRGLRFDPDRVVLQAFGESFEGCAHTWTTMLPPYLGVAARVEIPYEMTVPDSEVLLHSRYLRRVPLAHDCALYLFLDADDRPFAYYHRERIRLADPTFYARLPLETSAIVIKGQSGETLYPSDGRCGTTVAPDVVRATEHGVETAVKARNRGIGSPEPIMYISAPEVSADRFIDAAERTLITAGS